MGKMKDSTQKLCPHEVNLLHFKGKNTIVTAKGEKKFNSLLGMFLQLSLNAKKMTYIHISIYLNAQKGQAQ